MASATRRTPTRWKTFSRTQKQKSAPIEIATGHGNPGRYNFPIVLVTPKGNHLTRKFSEITLIEAGKNDWVVDKLP